MNAQAAAGTYQRSRGLKRTYTYTASFHFNGTQIIWGATVRHLGVYKGTPSGTIGATPADDPVGRVKCAVEDCIENLFAMHE